MHQQRLHYLSLPYRFLRMLEVHVAYCNLFEIRIVEETESTQQRKLLKCSFRGYMSYKCYSSMAKANQNFLFISFHIFKESGRLVIADLQGALRLH